MQDLSSAEHMRCVAVEAASRCVEPGTPTSGLLSRSQQIESYLTTGLFRTGARGASGVQVGYEGVSVLVDAECLTPEQAAAIGAFTKSVLA